MLGFSNDIKIVAIGQRGQAQITKRQADAVCIPYSTTAAKIIPIDWNELSIHGQSVLLSSRAIQFKQKKVWNEPCIADASDHIAHYRTNVFTEKRAGDTFAGL